MSRLRKLTFSVVSSYTQLVVAALFSLASFPMALHYLSRKEFGLWALMTAVNGYLNLIDLGMSGSIGRLLVDCKDLRIDGAYGSMVKTGWLVLLAQGVLLCVGSQLLAPLICRLLRIEPEFYRQFLAMLRWQGLFLGFDFMVRMSSHILQAHQRFDILNFSGILGLLLNFLFLWCFLHFDVGVFSLVWSWMIGGFASIAYQMLACRRLKLFPERGQWGRPSWVQFRHLFDYGKDIFLVTLGAQLISASQTMIVKRVLGLEAPAVWVAGTRLFTMILQIIWKPFDFSCPALAEMLVRGEHARLRERYKTISILTFSLSAVAAVGFALCNSLFVAVWLQGKIVWPVWNDVLLGIWMILQSVNHCHVNFVLVTKRIGFMRYIYFAEGVVFVAAALLAAHRWGMTAIPAVSIVCTMTFSCAYTVRRVSRYFQLPVHSVALSWMKSAGAEVLFFAPAAVVVWLAGQWLHPLWLRLVLFVIFSGVMGGFLLLRLGIPKSFRDELLRRLPTQFAFVLKRAF